VISCFPFPLFTGYVICSDSAAIMSVHLFFPCILSGYEHFSRLFATPGPRVAPFLPCSGTSLSPYARSLAYCGDGFNSFVALGSVVSSLLLFRGSAEDLDFEVNPSLGRRALFPNRSDSRIPPSVFATPFLAPFCLHPVSFPNPHPFFP